MFNTEYGLYVDTFDKPIHCVQNHFVKFGSLNIDQAFLDLVF